MTIIVGTGLLRSADLCYSVLFFLPTSVAHSTFMLVRPVSLLLLAAGAISVPYKPGYNTIEPSTKAVADGRSAVKRAYPADPVSHGNVRVIPAGSAAIESALWAHEQAVDGSDKRDLLDVAEGDGDSGSGCADVMVVYARGTAEAGTIGSAGNVGPELEAALQALLAPTNKSLVFEGVPYPASYIGFFEGGSPEGSKEMALQLSQAATLCPKASLVSSGYSQGGQLVHNSAKLLAQHNPTVLSHIKAVVIFGDPDEDQSLQGIPASDTDIICHPEDAVCAGGGLLDVPFIILTLPAHLDYNKGPDVDNAAQFIFEKVSN
ncbi:cutinase-domain-containing protein [Mycena pura]|uniref:Cutinase n=1 Tax=Mycena pura TaxID=153505 RepID=A0AAD6YQY5_9AGAR|nr:cutinase-domain-containing protein [Mycena pura]